MPEKKVAILAFAIISVLVLSVSEAQTTGTITTVAGTGDSGFSGDNGQATSAKLTTNYVISAIDNSGNIFFIDKATNRIRRVDKDGIITTVAGTGDSGYSGDDGQATSAKLNNPLGLSVDTSGNLYIADSGNNRIRRVEPSGKITTVYGTGTKGFSGDGGQAVQATFDAPTDISIDLSGNVYIADANNYRIRKISPAGTITTYAGNGQQGYSGDDGPAISAKISYPKEIVADSSGNLYIADLNNHRIRKVSNTGIITTYAGNGQQGFSGDNGQAANANIWSPSGISLDSSGNLYIADTNNHRIRKVDKDGIITTIAGTGTAGFSGDGGSPTLAKLNYPNSITLSSSGVFYISDGTNNKIRKVVFQQTSATPTPGTQTPSPTPTSSCTPYTLNTSSSSVSPQNLYVGGQYTIYCDYGTANLDCIDVEGPLGCTKTGFNGTKSVFSCKAEQPVTNTDVACKLLERTNSKCCLSLPRKIGNLTIQPMVNQSNLLLSSSLSSDNKTATITANYSSNSSAPIANSSCIISYSDQPLQQHQMAYLSAGLYNHSRTFQSKPTGINVTVSCSHPSYVQQTATMSLDTGKQENVDTPISVTLQAHKSVQTTGTVTFSCSATGTDIRELSLYTNSSGIWKKEDTKQISQDKSSYNFTLSNLKDGFYLWNCEARSGSGKASFASTTQVVTVKLSGATPAPEATDTPTTIPTPIATPKLTPTSPTPTVAPKPTPEPKKKEEGLFTTTNIIIIAGVVIFLVLILIVLKRRGGKGPEESSPEEHPPEEPPEQPPPEEQPEQQPEEEGTLYDESKDGENQEGGQQ